MASHLGVTADSNRVIETGYAVNRVIVAIGRHRVITGAIRAQVLGRLVVPAEPFALEHGAFLWRWALLE